MLFQQGKEYLQCNSIKLLINNVMKKVCLMLVTVISLLQFSYAQWTTSGSNIYNSNTGNVGIGTTSPLSLLSVGSGSLADNNIPIQLSTSGTSTVKGIGFNKNGAYGLYMGYDQGVVTTGGFIRQISTDPLSVIVNNTSTAMTFLSNGHVGIGTTNPGTYLLAVNGNVHAQQVNVDLTGWSDYVFKRSYVLRPLTEVQAYIDQNHHLPDMPSEQQVIKDGLNLGEMNKLLMKKVEELTLYLIDDNKKSSAQQTELNQQKQKLLDQEQHIKRLEAKLDELLKKNH
jgi:hypothetical protein